MFWGLIVTFAIAMITSIILSIIAFSGIKFYYLLEIQDITSETEEKQINKDCSKLKGYTLAACLLLLILQTILFIF